MLVLDGRCKTIIFTQISFPESGTTRNYPKNSLDFFIEVNSN